MIAQLKGRKVYFDTNPFIYFVEGHKTFYEAVYPLFELTDTQQIIACTSQLTLTELLIKPYRDKLSDVIGIYKGLLLDSGCFSVFGMSQDSFLAAAQLGGELKMRMPDALHLVSALENQCDYFVTNDKRIRSFQDLEVIQVTDLLKDHS